MLLLLYLRLILQSPHQFIVIGVLLNACIINPHWMAFCFTQARLLRRYLNANLGDVRGFEGRGLRRSGDIDNCLCFA